MQTPLERRIHSAAAVLELSPVIPVVVVDDVASAVPLARALLHGGVPVIEITLRSAAGVDSIRAVAAEVEGMVVGAGTVLTAEQAAAATAAGAQFLVTPGSPSRLLDAVLETGVPLLAGAGTLTEMLTLAERGLEVMKFFPAEASGGRSYLSAVFGRAPGCGSVRRAGSLRRTWPATSRFPTSGVSADRGSRRRTRSPQVTGPASRRWPPKPRS